MKNKKVYRDRVRKWQKENPEKVRLYRQISKLRRKQDGKKENGRKNSTQRWFMKILKRDGAKCRQCGAVKKLTLEHIKPKCVGGKNSFENLIILCLSCNVKNYRKLVKEALEFYFENKKV